MLFVGSLEAKDQPCYRVRVPASPLGPPIEKPVRHGVTEHRGTEKILLLLVSRDSKEYAPNFCSS